MAKKTETVKIKEEEKVSATSFDPMDLCPIEEVEDAFKSKKDPKYMGGKERVAHDVELLIIEWTIRYPTMKPTTWLMTIKGYNLAQTQHFLGTIPEPQWQEEKAKIREKLFQSTAQFHIDKMVEVEDQHIRASRLTLAKAVEMLSKGQAVIDRETGEPKLGPTGNPVFWPIRSSDLLNCASSIEKAQQIYRRAMGLPNDEGGLHQLIEAMQKMQLGGQTNVQINNYINDTASPEVRALEKEMTYDEILAFVKAKREAKKLEIEAARTGEEVKE